MAVSVIEPHPIIEQVMSDYDVTPEEIPIETPFEVSDLNRIRRGSKRYFHTKAFASYRCVCKRSWKSAHSWCITDLKVQNIIHKFGQDCQGCERDVNPIFDLEAMRKMAEYAVKTYLRRAGRLSYDPRPLDDWSDMGHALDDVFNGPHDQARCETCRLLGTSCWK